MIEFGSDDCTMEMSEEAKAIMTAHRAGMAAKEEQELLDSFAMAALTGLLASYAETALPAPGSAAGNAYRYADACMAERKRRMEARQA